MALVYKVHIQGGSANTALFPDAQISIAATYVGMVSMCE